MARWERDYYDGYSAAAPHPVAMSTGCEGRCEICGGRPDSREHDKPWTRTRPRGRWIEEPEDYLDPPADIPGPRHPGSGGLPV